MSTAVFAFDDLASARRAVGALKDRGIAEEAIRVHGTATSSQQAAGELDEFVTGGFIHSSVDLFEGIFQGNSGADRSALFNAVAQRGGEVVSVSVASEGDRAAVDEVMTAAQPFVRTDWVAAAGQ